MSLINSVNARSSDILAIAVGIGVFLSILWRLINRTRTTKLAGPARTSWIYRFNRLLNEGPSDEMFQAWQKEYGNVFAIPTAMGGTRVVLMDPRAIAYVWNGNPYNFWCHEGARRLIKNVLGGGILVAEGEDHRRHRRSMSPGFTPAAIRSFTTFSLDAARGRLVECIYYGKSDRRGFTECRDMDSIGLAGFSHNFDCVLGQRPVVMVLFNSGGRAQDFFSTFVQAVFQALPAVVNIPLGRNKRSLRLRRATADIAKKLLNDRKAEGKDETAERRSIISTLIKAENRTLSEDEVLAELNTLILAGFETTSTAMTWCIHELSMRPEAQEKLRSELAKYPDPTHDQLANEMPYLDAVVNETLRTHPVVPENHRVAVSDDVIPLLHPVKTASGKTVDLIRVKAGTGILVPIEAANRSTLIWGPDAHVFDPDRWLTGDLPARAREMQGYRHLLSDVH